MDSSHFSNTFFVPVCPIPKPELHISRNDSKIIPSKSTVSFFDSYICQSFSLPDSLMFYLVKNPSTAKCYEKIIQSCKYFFIKNPIFVVSKFDLECDNNNEWHSCFNGKPIELNGEKNKIWASHVINIHNKNYEFEQNLVPFVLPKFYLCDISEISLLKIFISINEIINFASKCKKVKFSFVTVINDDGTVASLETIFEIFHSIEYLHFSFPDNNSAIITSKTMEHLLKIPHFDNLTHFGLYCIPESFNIDSFYKYMKKNKKARLALEFSDSEEISEAYKNRLQAIIDEVLADENRDYKAPHLYYPGSDLNVGYKLWRLSVEHERIAESPWF